MADQLVPGVPAGAPLTPPAPPPAGGAAPAAQVPQAGLEAAAKKSVMDALKLLKVALPRLAPGSDIEKAVMKALTALSPVIGKETESATPAPGTPMGGPRPAFVAGGLSPLAGPGR